MRLVFPAAFLLFSCSPGDPEIIAEKSLTAAQKDSLVAQQIKTLLGDAGQVTIDSYPLQSAPLLQSWYQSRNYRPFWISDGDTLPRASLLYAALDQSWTYGFDPGWYSFSGIKSRLDSAHLSENFVVKSHILATVDVLLSNAYFLHHTHLAKGWIDTGKMETVFRPDSLYDLGRYLEASSDSDFLERLYAFQPSEPEYCSLQEALSVFVRTQSLWDEPLQFPDVKKDSAAYWEKTAAVLLRLHLLDSTTVTNDSLLRVALLTFQRWHGLDEDGKPGLQTTASLIKTNYERFLQAALALEKWRWKNSDTTFRFRVNIPSYELQIRHHDSILQRFKVVVGAPLTQTPEFSAKLKWMTLYPYWHLPHSISSTEFLAAMQRNPEYALKNNYRVFGRDKTELDPTSINWNKHSKQNFPYRIRQDGGKTNSLGLIVFYFPNTYDVYMHDTPAKHLFSRTMRAFSHGCIRVEHPFQLAEILYRRQWPDQADTVNADTLYNRASLAVEEERMNFPKSVPIEMDYITVTTDSLGSIRFHLDVYNRDRKYLDLLRNPFR